MGLFSWIKNSYYDHRLTKAERFALSQKQDKAILIYKALLGKHPLAIVNYSQLLVSNSDSCSLMLKNLKLIEDLRQYKNDSNGSQYEKILNDFALKIDDQSIKCFNAKNYKDAVALSDAIFHLLSHDDSFCIRKNRSHAFLSFESSQTLEIYEAEYQILVQSLSQYPSKEDIDTFIEILESEGRFKRVVSLLLPLMKIHKDYEQKIIECSILIVEGKDLELKAIKSLVDFCDNRTINKKSAKKIWDLSLKYEKQTSYADSVRLDLIACEFLSDDEAFNYDRCSHMLAEMALRYNRNEYQQLFALAKELGLNETKINTLVDKVYEVLLKASSVEAINICSLFNEERFRTLYIKNALTIAPTNKSILDLDELKSIIIANTTQDSIVDVLAPFVSFITEYKDYFVEIATEKIKRHADVAMLDAYWSIAAADKYFRVLLNDSCRENKIFADHFVQNSSVYLSNKSFVYAIGEELTNITDAEFAIKVLEKLIAKNINVQQYYIQSAIAFAKKTQETSLDQALIHINHALCIIPAEQVFLDEKKLIIRKLISKQEFDIAEVEADSILSLDEEGYTILAELHLAKAEVAKGNKAKKKELFEVLKLNEGHDLYSSFAQGLEKTLEMLVCSAEKLFEIDENEAYSICERIGAYTEQWIQLYLKLRNLGFDNKSSVIQKIKYYKESIDSVVAKVAEPASITNQLYINLWNEYINTIVEKSKSQPNDKAISSLQQLKSDVKKLCPDVSDKTSVSITGHVIQNLWLAAIDLESSGNYTSAIEQYSAIRLEAKTCESLPFAWLDSNDGVRPQGEEIRILILVVKAERRLLICKLKDGSVDESTESEISQTLRRQISTLGIEEDLAYRYAYFLLKQTRPAEAEEIIKTYLPNEKELLDFCVNIFVKRAEMDLSEFNDKLKLIEQGKMSSEEAKDFLLSIDSIRDKISVRLSDTKDKFVVYKKVVEKYILRAYFNEEKYAEAYAYLRSTCKDFMENDKSFRNFAIASLRLVESGAATNENIKFAISTWITAIFTDRLFVKSLNYTEWDDEYTFTLKDSIGDADFDELPDNVNYEDPVDNQIVSIKEVQNNLLNRMESSIRENYPQYEIFYNEEKSALESLVELHLDVKCELVAPYISQEFGKYRDSIKTAFEEDLSHEYGNEEQIYALGIRYNFKDQVYVQYRQAKQDVDDCIKALNALDPNAISLSFAKVQQIREYEGLFADLKANVSNVITKAVKEEMEYRKFLDIFFNICNRMNDNSISFICTQYINGQVVRRLNAKSMELRVGADYLYKLYRLTPTNVQVKENLEGVLQQLAEKCETGGNASDKSTLNTILSATGDTFASAILTAKVGGIAENLKNEKITAKNALEQVYDLYTNNKSNDLICGILAALCVRCIHEYVIGDAYGRSGVESLLNRIANNRSPQFLSQAKQIAKAYNDIWSKLDLENKMLLSGGTLPNRSLNDKGYALKSGLDLMKRLAPSGSITSNLFGGLGGLF